MYIAEIRGKLSPKVEAKEDILTCNVFSFFKYSSHSIFLKGYLEELGFNVSRDEAINAVFDFWPRYEDYTEPDLVITAGDYYFLVEAKYFSDFAEETQKTKAQLVRGVHNGLQQARINDKIFVLVAITADSYEKPERLQTLPGELQSYCKWTNWQTIAKFLQRTADRRQPISVEDRLFALDLYELLDRKKLRSFNGLDELFKNVEIINACDEVFFNARTAKFRGDFIGFVESLSFSKPLSVSPSYIFLDQSKQLFRNTDYPIMNESKNIEIFFRRS